MKFLALVPIFLALVSASAPAGSGLKHKRVPAAPGNPNPPLLAKRDCNANNCARAVTGTRSGKMPDVTSRMADCSSFQLTTVYTYPFVGSVASSSAPTAVPTYASACSTPVSPQSAYASACSCWGITPSATTATATFDPACTSPAPSSPCTGNIPGFGSVPSPLKLVTCPLNVTLGTDGELVPGCACLLDTSGAPFCDAGYAGFFVKSCTTNADCEPFERCHIDACHGSSCEIAVPGSQCDNGATIYST